MKGRHKFWLGVLLIGLGCLIRWVAIPYWNTLEFQAIFWAIIGSWQILTLPSFLSYYDFEKKEWSSYTTKGEKIFSSIGIIFIAYKGVTQLNKLADKYLT